MIKEIVLSAILAFTAVGCSQTNEYMNHDVPEVVSSWAQDNVWMIQSRGGTGSGFSIDEDTVITACHVVENSKEIILINNQDTRLIEMEVQSCNKDLDVAVLKWKGGDALNSTFTGFHPVPAPGKGVWGSGFPLGAELLTTQGHMGLYDTSKHNYKSKFYYITAPTVPGDSGSPAIAIFDGVPLVIGVRAAIRVMPLGFTGMAMINHMALIAPTKSILKEIHKDVEGF